MTADGQTPPTVQAAVSAVMADVRAVAKKDRNTSQGGGFLFRGIDAVVLEARSRAHVESRIRAGLLEQGAVETMGEAGVAERLHRDGLVHHGLQLRFGHARNHLAWRFFDAFARAGDASEGEGGQQQGWAAWHRPGERGDGAG